MGFPDDFAIPVSDTQAYRQFGNSVVVPVVEKIAEAAKVIHDELGFDLLSAITAVDYWPQESPRFHLIYQMTSLASNLSLQIRVPVNGDNPKVPTVTRVYGNANWREREVWDMFGVVFEGHSDMRRILCPDDWEGYPLRKDYAPPKIYREMPV